jgi:hypothetical protein
LFGGFGRRNLLIAGAAAGSQIFGGNLDDILIGGYTDWDQDPNWLTALTAIMAEWTSGSSFNDRVDHLRRGTGLNAPYILDNTTVHSNNGSSGNLLMGGPGQNLYYGNLGGDLAPSYNSSKDAWINIV